MTTEPDPLAASPPPPGAVAILRADERPATLWRNGGGLTREIARGAADPAEGDFDWRVSIAEVSADGPFSAFAGVRRTIVLIAGSAMTLTIDGVDHVLGLYQPLTFDGGSVTSCAVPAGPTRDLNVMTTVGRATAQVGILRPEGPAGVPVAGADPLLLVVLAGAVRVAGPDGGCCELAELDALRWSGPGSLAVSGAGVVAAVRFTGPNGGPDPQIGAWTS